MRITILGAGTAIPSPGRSPAGVLVQLDSTPLLFDIGPGTLGRLAAAGINYRDLAHVFLTHHHSDHTLDLVTLIQVNDPTPLWTRTEILHLFGPRGTLELYDRLMLAYPGIAPWSYTLDIRELEPGRIVLNGCHIEAARTGHTPNSIGYRLEAKEGVVVYTGDASAAGDLVNLAREADVLICECAFPRGYQTPDHMTADGAGRLARVARVKRLVLTHLYPPALEADILGQVCEEFDGRVDIAVDGMNVVLGREGMA